jgi:hypothetical protein
MLLGVVVVFIMASIGVRAQKLGGRTLVWPTSAEGARTARGFQGHAPPGNFEWNEEKMNEIRPSLMTILIS